MHMLFYKNFKTKSDFQTQTQCFHQIPESVKTLNYQNQIPDLFLNFQTQWNPCYGMLIIITCNYKSIPFQAIPILCLISK